MKFRSTWPVLLAASLILSGCRLSAPAPTAVLTLTPSPQPTATATTAPTATAEIPDPVALFSGLPLESYEEGILSFLNAGGQPADLAAAVAGPAETPTGHAGWSGEVNGDGRPDFIASLIQPDETAVIPPGRLLIFLSGAGGGYERAYEWASGVEQGAAQVALLQDLDADGQAEIIAAAQTCGAHTCFRDAHLLEWDGTAIQDRTPASTAELPDPQIAAEDADSDGVFDVLISPAGIGSAGAGPYRGANLRWVFADGAWTAQSEPQPPQYLIHAVHEGDDLLAAGRLPEAREWYQAVLNQDPTLQLSGLVEDEVPLLSAFAVFRLVQVALLTGDTAAADELLNSAADSPAATGSGTPYIVLAQLYRQAFDGRNPAAACEVIQGFIRGREAEILTPLGSQTFGYANRDYAPEHFCPPAAAPP